MHDANQTSSAWHREIRPQAIFIRVGPSFRVGLSLRYGGLFSTFFKKSQVRATLLFLSDDSVIEEAVALKLCGTPPYCRKTGQNDGR